MCGDGWLAVGDAGGFIDPLFSTGAHLAMHGALRAADAIHAALAADDVTAARLEAWEREMRAGADLFIGAVQAFYAGDLAQYLFAEPQHPFLRRAITSLLSGDVFDGTPCGCAKCARGSRAALTAERPWLQRRASGRQRAVRLPDARARELRRGAWRSRLRLRAAC